MYQEKQTPDEEVLEVLRKRRNIYTIITACSIVGLFIAGFLPDGIGDFLSTLFMIVDGISAGCGMLCINQYRFEKSCGTKKGGGLWWLGLFIFGLILIPIAVVGIACKVKVLGELITGLKLQK